MALQQRRTFFPLFYSRDFFWTESPLKLQYFQHQNFFFPEAASSQKAKATDRYEIQSFIPIDKSQNLVCLGVLAFKGRFFIITRI